MPSTPASRMKPTQPSHALRISGYISHGVEGTYSLRPFPNATAPPRCIMAQPSGPVCAELSASSATCRTPNPESNSSPPVRKSLGRCQIADRLATSTGSGSGPSPYASIIACGVLTKSGSPSVSPVVTTTKRSRRSRPSRLSVLTGAPFAVTRSP